MGARVYDPYTGTFLQTDPIQGGGATPYGYTDGDPVNERDLTGRDTAEDEAGDFPAETGDMRAALVEDGIEVDVQASPDGEVELKAGNAEFQVEEIGSPLATNRGVGGQAGTYNVDELSQMAYEHGQGADNASERPSAAEIETTILKAQGQRLEGQNAVQFERGGVRVIINEDSPVRSTAYRVRK
jgi:hypothetical protein